LLLPGGALAHIERASYWPNPAPDCSVTPCAGGEVPTARSLASAVTTAVTPACQVQRNVRVSLRGRKGQRLRRAKI
jgi:hypothetical protein